MAGAVKDLVDAGKVDRRPARQLIGVFTGPKSMGRGLLTLAGLVDLEEFDRWTFVDHPNGLAYRPHPGRSTLKSRLKSPVEPPGSCRDLGLGLGVDPHVLGRRGNDRAIDPDSLLPDWDLDTAQTLSKKTGVGAGGNDLWSLEVCPRRAIVARPPSHAQSATGSVKCAIFEARPGTMRQSSGRTVESNLPGFGLSWLSEPSQPWSLKCSTWLVLPEAMMTSPRLTTVSGVA
jgi:hypothetical protein